MSFAFKFKRAFVFRVLAVIGSVALAGSLSTHLSARQVAVDPAEAVCFPTCAGNDARFLVVAGDDPTTFAAVDVLVGVSAPLDGATLHFGVFDGDAGLNWDKNVLSTPPPALEIELWADPDRAGPSSPNAVLLKTYTPSTATAIPFVNNGWADVFETHSAVDPTEIAKTAFAYRYTLRVRALSPAANRGWNSFKLRTLGTLGVFAETFGFLGAYTHSVDRTTVYPNFVSLANLGPTTYDGTWQFGFSVPSGVPSFDVWDGDFDFGNCIGVLDDDDPNTPNEVPSFASALTTRPEGVGRVIASDGGGATLCGDGQYPTGLPMDDNGLSVFERYPAVLAPAGVAYEVVDPLGINYVKSNPSGQREWERLTVAAPLGGELNAGIYQVNVHGVDLSNLNFWKFQFRALGLPPSGPPAGEDAFYRIGRLVWYDTNANAVHDSGEPVLPNVTVTVYDENNNIQTGKTDASGQFYFRKPAGSYTVVVDGTNFNGGGPLNGMTSTTGGEIETGVAVNAATPYAEAIFGYVMNQPPSTTDDTGLCLCSGTTTISPLANDSDPDNDALTITAVGVPSRGTATLNGDGTITYASTAGATGSDSFSYTISDGRGGSATGTVTISLLNTLAVLTADSGSTEAGTPVTIAVLGNDSDPDGQTLTVASATNGANGTVVVNADGSVTYTPNAGFVGTDTFTYTVFDGCEHVSTSVTVTVTAPPTCDAGGFTTYTPGGWGAKPSGNNPGMLLSRNFSTVYPGGSVTIGSGTKVLTFTSAKAIEVFLPLGGNPGVLNGSATNPKTSVGGPFIGHLLSLQLAADFSRAGVLKSGLGNMAMLSGPLAGQTVNQILALANGVAGGTAALPSGVTLTSLQDTLVAIIMNYHEGTVNGGLLGCGGGTPPPPPPPPPVDPPPATGSGVCSGGVTKLVLKYIGSGSPSGVVSAQRSAPGNGPIVAAQVSGGLYTFATTEMGGLFDSVSGGRLANNLSVFVGTTKVADVHTSCSVPIYPGMKVGNDFEIVALWTRGGGLY